MNVVVDTLSCKTHLELASMMCHKWKMISDLNEFHLDLYESEEEAYLFTLSAQLELVKRVIEAQLDDDEVKFLLNEV